MNKKYKILIVGIGGVGAYLGGLLAREYYNHSKLEIYFLARGENLKAIKNKGLKVLKGESEFVAYPKLATDNPDELAAVDLMIICTKSYDVQYILPLIKNLVNKSTLILPLQNGIDSFEKVKTYFPEHMVLEACIYIVVSLVQPGVVENIGNIQKLYFGLSNVQSYKIEKVLQVFKAANIDAELKENITSVVWEKFIFISAIATATAYFNNSIGAILERKDQTMQLICLLNEVHQVALGRGIIVQENIVELTISKYKLLPYDTTPSMYNDFKKGNGKTELNSLTKYVIEEGQKYNVSVPIFQKMYLKLSSIN